MTLVNGLASLTEWPHAIKWVMNSNKPATQPVCTQHQNLSQSGSLCCGVPAVICFISFRNLIWSAVEILFGVEVHTRCFTGVYCVHNTADPDGAQMSCNQSKSITYFVREKPVVSCHRINSISWIKSIRWRGCPFYGTFHRTILHLHNGSALFTRPFVVAVITFICVACDVRITFLTRLKTLASSRNYLLAVL